MGHPPSSQNAVQDSTASADATRAAILDAGESLFGRFGYRKTTVQEIAHEAGIGKGTIYLHFESKHQVALSTVDRLIQRVVDRLEKIAAGQGAVADRIRGILVERVLIRFDGVQKYSGRIDELLAEIRHDLLARRRYYFHTEALILARLLDEGTASGEIVAESSEVAAEAMITATNALLPYDLSTRELGRRSDIERQVQAVVDILLHGVVAS